MTGYPWGENRDFALKRRSHSWAKRTTTCTLCVRPLGQGAFVRPLPSPEALKAIWICVATILGISAFYHDSAAALVVDGDIVAAGQEERFTRKKHDPGFPANAIAYCLKEGGVQPETLDYVAFYDKPLTKFDRLLETYLAYAPAGFKSFRLAMPLWLKDKLHMRRTLRQRFDAARHARLVFTDHHESHAASAFFPSPFDRAAILTIDGVGEWSTATFGIGEGNKLRLMRQLRFPHSLGLLYSAFTYYCGFRVNSGEYKLMGLAPYGQPVYQDLILKHLIQLQPDGSFWMDMKYFNYCQGLTMTNDRFHQLFGGPPRSPESMLEQRHMDLAASIQKVTEEILMRMAHEVQRQTRMKNLVLAGGVALNCVANGRLLREGPFDNIWIQPAAGDAGGALGAAIFVWYHLMDKPRPANGRDCQKGSLLGPSYTTEQIAQFLAGRAAPHQRYDNEGELLQCVAQMLAEGKIIGWLHGRMEFGPRALGARSIIGDARNPTMQATMNLKIKFRESFRPFAPCVLQERASDYFALRPDQESPYMLLVAPVREQHRVAISDADRQKMTAAPDLRHRVNIVRSTVPAITHVDYSARVQTVDEARHGRFYRLMKAFEQITDCPVIVNTSFNVRGEPIVCTPQEAYRCFLATDMDALVLEDFVLRKEQMNQAVTAAEREKYLAQFELD
jgi:carbamoyltransferase